MLGATQTRRRVLLGRAHAGHGKCHEPVPQRHLLSEVRVAWVAFQMSCDLSPDKSYASGGFSRSASSTRETVLDTYDMWHGLYEALVSESMASLLKDMSVDMVVVRKLHHGSHEQHGTLNADVTRGDWF